MKASIRALAAIGRLAPSLRVCSSCLDVSAPVLCTVIFSATPGSLASTDTRPREHDASCYGHYGRLLRMGNVASFCALFDFEGDSFRAFYAIF